MNLKDLKSERYNVENVVNLVVDVLSHSEYIKLEYDEGYRKYSNFQSSTLGIVHGVIKKNPSFILSNNQEYLDKFLECMTYMGGKYLKERQYGGFKGWLSDLTKKVTDQYCNLVTKEWVGMRKKVDIYMIHDLIRLYHFYQEELKRDIENQKRLEKLDQEIEEIKSKYPNEYIGEIGQRRNFDVVIEKVIKKYDYTIIICRDTETKSQMSFYNKFKFADKINEGVSVQVRGTINGHKENRGLKTTSLNRVEVNG
jgi:hypothetical protein